MANVVEPLILLPRNAPFQCSSDYVAGVNHVNVQVGDGTTDDIYFNGTFFVRPNNTTLGIDLNKYIRDIANIKELTPKQLSVYETQLLNFVKPYSIKMFDILETSKYDFDGYVFAGNPRVVDLFRLLNGEKIGRYREAGTFDNGTQYDMLLHNRVYTFNALTEKLTTAKWNKAVIGAPLGQNIWNPKALVVTGGVEYYNDDKTLASSQSFPALTNDFDSYTAFYVQQDDNTHRYSAFKFLLAGEGETTRAVFVERLTPCKDNLYMIYYVNRLGGIDWITMSGKNYERSNVGTRKTFESELIDYSGDAFVGGVDRHANVQYYAESTEVFELNSDLETASEYKWLEELIASPRVWVWDYENQTVRAARVTDNDFEFKNYRNNQMFNFNVRLEADAKNTM